ISAGICELIERDAVAVWHAQRILARAHRRLDLSSIDDEDCATLLERYAAAGIVPRVWDVTSDVGVPTFVCDIPTSAQDPVEPLRRFRGAGCHPDRRIALARALTEAAQVRLTYIAGNRDDLPAADYQETSREKLGAALIDAISATSELRSFSDAPHFPSD